MELQDSALPLTFPRELEAGQLPARQDGARSQKTKKTTYSAGRD